MKILSLLFSLLLVSCATTSPPNSCVLDSVSYKYTLQAKNMLKDGYAKVLVVKYARYDMGHAYLVFKTDKYLCFYDAYHGSGILTSSQADELSPRSAAQLINWTTNDFKGELILAAYW